MKNCHQRADVHALIQRKLKMPVTLVAIDGHSAAGKTTWATIIQESNSHVTVLHIDDFYRPMNAADRELLDAIGGYERYYDWERLEAQVLMPLHNRRIGRYQAYNWQTNRLDQVWQNVKPKGIIVVEGCYAMRPELRKYYNVMILVESSAKMRWQRQLERADASEEWFRRWDAAERHYMETYRPREAADLVIGGDSKR
ncbi:hypothetical protein KFU94_38810 [Chloroflexi bacterium TSY]|nr:hypothetical protein [Chloroflexi bacterium TSY]